MWCETMQGKSKKELFPIRRYTTKREKSHPNSHVNWQPCVGGQNTIFCSLLLFKLGKCYLQEIGENSFAVVVRLYANPIRKWIENSLLRQPFNPLIRSIDSLIIVPSFLHLKLALISFTGIGIRYRFISKQCVKITNSKSEFDFLLG